MFGFLIISSGILITFMPWFDDYYRPPATVGSSAPETSSCTGAAVAPSHCYGGSYLLDAVQSFQKEEKASSSPCDELTQYLESGPEPTDNVICWWGVCYSIIYVNNLSLKYIHLISISRTPSIPH